MRACATPPIAQRGSEPQTVAGLGTTTFPTSARSDAAQVAFLRGLLLLHLFEYPDTAGSEWVSMGVPSDGSHGIAPGVTYGYPVTCKDGKYEIVQGLAEARHFAGD